MATRNQKQAEVPRQRRSNQADEDTQAMMFEGLNLTQLAKLFRMDRRDVTPKLRDIPAAGTRGGYPIYFVHEVAPHLVKPIYDIEAYIMRMNHNDLPKHVSKEFWNGLRARQAYELENGDLWPTDKVLEVMGEVFKQLRMSMLLFGDTIERDTQFTDGQRKKLSAMVDGALNDLADGLIGRFSAPKVDDEEI